MEIFKGGDSSLKYGSPLPPPKRASSHENEKRRWHLYAGTGESAFRAIENSTISHHPDVIK
jgi:hypothetical protein